jgi:hypothetical protein
MAIKSGCGGGTGRLDSVPVSTVRSTVSYFPTSKTFCVVLVAEAEAEAEAGTEVMALQYEASKLPHVSVSISYRIETSLFGIL